MYLALSEMFLKSTLTFQTQFDFGFVWQEIIDDDEEVSRVGTS